MRAFFYFLVTTVCLASCTKDPTPHVRYWVACDYCDINYTDKHGEYQTEYGVRNNWSYAFEGKSGDEVGFSVLKIDTLTVGTLQSKIYYNGKVVSSDRITGILIISGGDFELP